MQRLMLDTNIFNDLADGKVSLDVFSGKQLYATHVQIDELKNTKDYERREKLLEVFSQIDTSQVSTQSAIWNVSAWNECKWSDDDGLFEDMLKYLKELDPKNRKPDNQNRDILIAETAIKLGCVLISNDANLGKVVSKFGGETSTLIELSLFG